MKIPDLIAIGQYLHGEKWQSPLARELGLNRATIYGWLNGTYQMREKQAEKIFMLAAIKLKNKTWSCSADKRIKKLLKQIP